jgi:hypothetical protein
MKLEKPENAEYGAITVIITGLRKRMNFAKGLHVQTSETVRLTFDDAFEDGGARWTS